MSWSRKGDPKDRVTRAYELHAPAVAAYVVRRAAPGAAPDAVAETFLVAWRRRDILPLEPDTLPWLYGVARNVLANQRRSEKRRTQLADRLAATLVHYEVDPPSFDEAEEFSRVAKVLNRLSPEDAEILRLASWEALSPSEIATVLDLSPGTARQRLHRARRRLRAQLDREDAATERLLMKVREEARQCSTNWMS